MATDTTVEAAIENMTVDSPAEAAADEENQVTVEQSDESTTNGKKSALQENLERKGKNAYYFAHAHKANGPKWDGKAEPKLLSSRSMSTDEQKEQVSKHSSSFDIHKSNITSYAFCDEGSKVKLYINLENVGEKCADEDITLDYTESSFCLIIKNYNNNYENDPTAVTSEAAPTTSSPPEQCLSFGRLTANITKASFKKKKDRVIVTLTKEKEGEWHTINDKGTPDHELV